MNRKILKKRMSLSFIKSDSKGQMLVEYILFLTVIISLAAAIFPRIKGLFDAEAECNGRDPSVICLYKQTFSPGQRFKFYTIRP